MVMAILTCYRLLPEMDTHSSIYDKQANKRTKMRNLHNEWSNTIDPDAAAVALQLC